AVGIVDGLAVAILACERLDRRPNGRAILAEPGDGQDVADATLDDLKLNRSQPRAVEVLARVAHPALRVEQHAAVAGVRQAIAPRRSAPAELSDELVIAIGLLGDEAAPDLAADADRWRAVDARD